MHSQFTSPSRTRRERTRPGQLDDAAMRTAPSEHAEPYGYVRVSTVMQRLKGYSIPKQLRQIAEAALSDGAPIPEGNLLGDADSGRNFERRSLQLLLQRAREGRVRTVYFTKVDRIGRNARDSLNIVHELRRCDVRMIVLDPRLDTSDPFGYFLFVILAAAAELESTQIMERTMGGRMEMLDQTSTARLPAKLGGRKARYGLRYVPAREPGERDRWERQPEEARWLLYIHTQIAAEHSAESVARDLNRRGVAGPEGGVWHAATVRQMVHADCYCGTMTRRLGGQEFTFPVEEIVPKELRQRARAQLVRNKARSPRNTKYEYLLAGTRSEPLLVCRTCWRAGEEHIMGGRTDHRRAARGWQARWYECKHGHAGADVRHRVAAARLEDAVWASICQMVQDPETVLARFERLADAASAEAREIEDEISRLAESQAENRLAQQRLLERAVRGKLAADLIGAQEDALEAEAHDLAARRALLEVQLEQARAGQAPLQQVRDALALLADGLLEATFEDKRWIIRQLVTRIWADKEGWQLEGCLPGLNAEGRYATAASIERTPKSSTGQQANKTKPLRQRQSGTRKKRK